MIAKHPGKCEHEYQDRIYGKGFRLMTETASINKKPVMYRCTVCAPKKEKSKHRGGEYDISQLIVLRR